MDTPFVAPVRDEEPEHVRILLPGGSDTIEPFVGDKPLLGIDFGVLLSQREIRGWAVQVCVLLSSQSALCSCLQFYPEVQ
jgi:hypothetical protein